VTDDVVLIRAKRPTRKYHGKEEESWEYWEDEEDGVKIRKSFANDKSADYLRENGMIPVTKAWWKRWVGSLVYGKFTPDGKLKELGQTSGVSDKMREKLTSEFNPFKLKTEYKHSVIEIKAMEQMKSGAYRHPTFERLRPDKDIEECVMEVDK